MMKILNTNKHMLQAKEQFKHIKYAAIMAMVCNSPFALAKYISSTGERNVRSIRSFLSYLIKEKVIDEFSLLELGRRIFIILLLTVKQQLPIEVLIEQYSDMSLEDQMEVNIDVTDDKESFEYAMWKSAEAFKKKKISLQTQYDKKSKDVHSVTESAMETSQRIKQQLQDVSHDEKAPS